MFPNGTIRVVSPVTEDGNRPKIDPVTRQPVFKEEFFPKSAMKAFNDQNNRLPAHLKKIIEVVSDGDVKRVQPQSVAVETVAPPVIVRNKPGPKPKQHAQTN
jgi:hypothetical protein